MRHLVVQIVYLGCYVYPNSFVSIHHRLVESVCAGIEAAFIIARNGPIAALDSPGETAASHQWCECAFCLMYSCRELTTLYLVVFDTLSTAGMHPRLSRVIKLVLLTLVRTGCTICV
eukprot:COSAG02_NODE_5493_length_4284_cov_1.722342_2_plen_117_part_00